MSKINSSTHLNTKKAVFSFNLSNIITNYVANTFYYVTASVAY